MEVLVSLIIDDGNSGNDNFLLIANKKRNRLYRRKRFLLRSILKKEFSGSPKVLNYFKIIRTCPDNVFHSYFQMSRSTFKALHNAVRPFWTTSLQGRCGYSLEKCLYLTLWKLCNSKITFRQLSDRFNVGKGITHKIFFKTIKTICSLKSQEIIWPSAEHQQNVMEDFQRSTHNALPFVIGCVDGIHLKIPTPNADAISYYNRKGNFAINMQGICDSNFRFLDVFIGYPGSYHDGIVWENSPIFKGITSGQVELAENAIILGDSDYPLSKYLMVPYEDNGHLSCEQKRFNYCLSATKVFIEQSFGILKQKFKMLNHIDVRSLKDISQVVLACTILHNFIINKESVSEYVNDVYINTNEPIHESENPRDASIESYGIEEDTDGITMRNNLTTLFV